MKMRMILLYGEPMAIVHRGIDKPIEFAEIEYKSDMYDVMAKTFGVKNFYGFILNDGNHGSKRGIAGSDPFEFVILGEIV